MTAQEDTPQDALSVFEFFEMLPDERAAIEFIEATRWPDGVTCPRCNSARTKKIGKQERYNCNECRRQFSVRTGTVFERSRIPLRKWLYAIYMIQTARKGISSIQLGKELGIQQKSAWFMLHRIREAMDPGLELLSGEIEVDEAYVGGAEKNKHANKKLHKRWIEGKQIVLGMRESNGRIVLRPVHSGEKVVITDEILFAIEEGSTIYTDEGNAYRDLHLWYTHEAVNHGIGEYVRHEITTNGMESVWAIVKRAHKGVYHHWSKKHGGRYLNEVAYRLVEGNVRIPIMARIRALARRSFEVQLTYKELIE